MLTMMPSLAIAAVVAGQQQAAPAVYMDDEYPDDGDGYADPASAPPASPEYPQESYPGDQIPQQQPGYDDQGYIVWDVRLFYDELSPYGSWVVLPGLGRVFRPATGGFQPYRTGYWVYTSYGFSWVSPEPFAWAVYHYGRWVWYGGAWYWVPDTRWGPAWVSST